MKKYYIEFKGSLNGCSGSYSGSDIIEASNEQEAKEKIISQEYYNCTDMKILVCNELKTL